MSELPTKRCRRCRQEWTPTSVVTSLTRGMCNPCWAEYQRALYRNPRTPEPCRSCGKSTRDARASIKYCPDCRFTIREKACSGCGAKYMPRSFGEMMSRSRCDRCYSVARKRYRHAEYHNAREPRPCVTCGEPTGDIRQSVRYCKTHSWIGEWWTRWKQRSSRTQAEHVARLAELERMKPYLEEQQWLRTAKKELASVKRLLRDRTHDPRHSQARASRPLATSPR